MTRYVAFTLLCFAAIPALAEDIPKGLGHPKSFPAPHWYDANCCSQRDCEPLPFSAVKIVEEGYRVRYRGSLGFLVDVLVPWDKAKPSKDSQHHGCATVDRFLCFYAAAGA